MRNQEPKKYRPQNPSKTNSSVYWIRPRYHNPIQQWLAYYLIAAMLYGLAITFIKDCCYSISPIYFLHRFADFLLSLLFGIHRWMWFHHGDAYRTTAGQTVVIYCILTMLTALLYDALLTRNNTDKLTENLTSVVFGVLVSHVPIALMLTEHDIEHPAFELLNLIFLNVATAFSASIYCIFHMNQLPVVNILLNRTLVTAGFITGLAFITLYGTIVPPAYSLAFLGNTPSKLDFVAMIAISFSLSVIATLVFFKIFKLKQTLERLKARETIVEPDDDQEINIESIKERLRE